MRQTAFPQADRDAVAAFVDCLFRYADEKTYINLRAFHDLKDGAPPLFVEPVKIGAPDFIERVCERIERPLHIPSQLCSVRPSVSLPSRAAQQQRIWPKASPSVSR